MLVPPAERASRIYVTPQFCCGCRMLRLNPHRKRPRSARSPSGYLADLDLLVVVTAAVVAVMTATAANTDIDSRAVAVVAVMPAVMAMAVLPVLHLLGEICRFTAYDVFCRCERHGGNNGGGQASRCCKRGHSY